MGMRKEHLTPDELEALARGEETDRGVGEHLRSCAACREAALEGTFATRYVRPLAGGHPDENVLTALWSHALAPTREAEVGAHVESCSRCQALLARLRRATPADSSPDWLSEHALARTRAWAVAATGPRRATLVARAIEGLQRVGLELRAIASSLEVGDLEPEPAAGPARAAKWVRFQRLELAMHENAAFEGVSDAEAGSADLAASVLNDGQHSFRFEMRCEGTAVCLAVTFVGARGAAETGAVALAFDSPGLAPQSASIERRRTAIFDVAPGASRLEIGTRPPWEIEIGLDA